MKQNHLYSLGAASLEEMAWTVDELVLHRLQNGLTLGVEKISRFFFRKDHSHESSDLIWSTPWLIRAC